ncbi:MAG: hypothetical protein CL912_27365 [Deltaproteobacteria bacterium]|nr:hypothetical protein [Deltaproteobacteria bacterium]
MELDMEYVGRGSKSMAWGGVGRISVSYRGGLQASALASQQLSPFHDSRALTSMSGRALATSEPY